MKKIITSLFVSFIFTYNISAQWIAVNNGLPGLETRGVANLKDTLVTAVKGKGVYYSVNNGDTWSTWKFNSKLPNFNFNQLSGEVLKSSPTGGGAVLLFSGQSMASYYEHGLKLANIPLNGITNLNIKNWFKLDVPDVLFVGTSGSGVFYNPNLASFSQSSGLTGGGLNINHISKLEDSNNDEITVLATDSGIYKTADAGKTFTAFNGGFTSPIKVNHISLFTLTENGIYFFDSETQSFKLFKPGGDYRALYVDMTTYNAYFFGNGIGTKVNMANAQVDNISLDGVTGGIITSTAIVGDYIYVCTENGGVFRKAINNLSVNDFNISQVAKFNIMPNPSNGEFTITTETPVELQLIDITGKLINTFSVENSKTINENLKSGIYLLKDKTNGGVKKLIVN